MVEENDLMRRKVRELEKKNRELERKLVRLEEAVGNMSDPVYRYRKSPFDRLYMFARRVKWKIWHILNPEKKISTGKQILPPAILPCVTVVIPTWKPNDYLEECVASVLNQNYDPEKLDVILSVNGADVAFAEWLEKRYADEKRIRVVYTPTPGVSAGRNHGKRFVSAEFMIYMDDDDFFTPNYIRTLAQHTGEGVTMVHGRIENLLPNGKREKETYINKGLRAAGAGLHDDYLKLCSCFSSPWAKLMRTSQAQEVWGDFDETLKHTEDVVFWVENIHKPMEGIVAVAHDNPEAYVRRIVANSLSRPEKEKEFAFSVNDRIKLIERLSEAILTADRDLRYKRFVLSKIDASTNHMLSYYDKCSAEEKAAVRKAVCESDCLFLNKSLFADIKAIAFCHNFSPAVDPSAFVAGKRLPQISEKVGKPLGWTVVCADMSGSRNVDDLWQRFFVSYQCKERLVVGGKTLFDEESQYKWGIEACKAAEKYQAEYIYSRSMWAGSHVAARLYKKAHPEVIWIAEFSDPISMGTNNKRRPPSRVYTGNMEHLNTFWRDVEQWVFDEADHIIYTNSNQQRYMLDSNPPRDRKAVEDKAWIWSHPRVPQEYTRVIQADYELDERNINIGYFGSFYANRKADPMFELLKNPQVHLHLFTNVTEELEDKVSDISWRIHLHGMVSHLEFLNIAGKMDYLFLNDIEFSGEITPYLPSKLADYLAVGTRIIALTFPNTPMSQVEEEKLIKTDKLNEEIIMSLKKRNAEFG